MIDFVSTASCVSKKHTNAFVPRWRGDHTVNVQHTHRGVEDVFRQGDVVIGHDAWDPSSVLSSPQDAVEVWKVQEDVITFLCPVAQFPVSHL